MSDERPALQQLFERLSQTMPTDSPEEIAAKAGVDAARIPPAPGEDVERAEYVDPATGSRVRTSVYGPSYKTPADWPADWPFIAGVEVALAHAESPAETRRWLCWVESDETNIDLLPSLLSLAMADLGWHEHPPETAPAAPGLTPLIWFHREADWRLLGRTETSTPRALLLSDVREFVADPHTETAR